MPISESNKKTVSGLRSAVINAMCKRVAVTVKPKNYTEGPPRDNGTKDDHFFKHYSRFFPSLLEALEESEIDRNPVLKEWLTASGDRKADFDPPEPVKERGFMRFLLSGVKNLSCFAPKSELHSEIQDFADAAVRYLGPLSPTCGEADIRDPQFAFFDAVHTGANPDSRLDFVEEALLAPANDERNWLGFSKPAPHVFRSSVIAGYGYKYKNARGRAYKKMIVRELVMCHALLENISANTPERHRQNLDKYGVTIMPIKFDEDHYQYLTIVKINDNDSELYLADGASDLAHRRNSGFKIKQVPKDVVDKIMNLSKELDLETSVGDYTGRVTMQLKQLLPNPRRPTKVQMNAELARLLNEGCQQDREMHLTSYPDPNVLDNTDDSQSDRTYFECFDNPVFTFDEVYDVDDQVEPQHKGNCVIHNLYLAFRTLAQEPICKDLAGDLLRYIEKSASYDTAQRKKAVRDDYLAGTALLAQAGALRH